jgi:hypothetical protein
MLLPDGTPNKTAIARATGLSRSRVQAILRQSEEANGVQKSDEETRDSEK